MGVEELLQVTVSDSKTYCGSCVNIWTMGIVAGSIKSFGSNLATHWTLSILEQYLILKHN